MQDDCLLIITGTGDIRCLYGEDLDLATLGAVEIRRASVVEPAACGGWTTDLALVGGPLLGEFPRRSDALAAERTWLARHWLSPPPLAATPGGNVKHCPSGRTGFWPLLILCVLLLYACDEEETEKARRAQAQRAAQMQAQLAAEQAQRVQAEHTAQAAQESRQAWMIALGAGTCGVSVVVLLVGIHIGSRAVERYRKEHPHA